jgi:hypothetical protein
VGTGFPKRSCSHKKITLESDSTPLNQTLERDEVRLIRFGIPKSVRL